MRARAARVGRPQARRCGSRLDPSGETSWQDVVRGPRGVQNELLDDFVILRSDGLPTYNFACVVDDHAMEITHVIRGDDHISNTRGSSCCTARSAGSRRVRARVDDPRRRRLAAVEAPWRDVRRGVSRRWLPAPAMDNFLALLGWAYDGKQELFTLEELERLFRLERVGANPAIFNLEKLEWMNGQHLKRIALEERVALVTDFLAAHGCDLSSRTPEWRTRFVAALGDRLKTLADAATVGRFALDDEVPIDAAAWAEMREKPEVATRLDALATALRDDSEWTLESLERATRELAARDGIKPGELMGMARVALTGSKASPGIFDVMWLVGRERAVARLEAAAARWRARAARGSRAE
jgi:glutamyl/glutaminyl-tRNA synthetase